jgi:hypothetical protein
MPRPLSLVLLCALGGCLFRPDVYEARRDELDDDDGDGWSSDAGDCDDRDPDRHPGATERCNGVDDDCNGTVDDADGEVVGYADVDGDGFGDPDASITGCDGGAAVDDANDCGPDDPAVFPGADEVCNGVDDDCDGAVDEDAIDALTGYVDADGDGFGDPASATRACSLDGLVSNATDCDDTDDWVYPGAPERFDGGPNACGGGGGAESLAPGDEALRWTGPVGFGVGVHAGTDLDGDGRTDLAVATPDTVYVFTGPLNGGTSDTARLTILGATGGLLLHPDADGDGGADVVVGTSDGLGLVEGTTRGEFQASPTLIGASAVLAGSAGWIVGGGDNVVLAWPTPAFGAPSLTLTDVASVTAAVILDSDGDGMDELWLGQPGSGRLLAFDLAAGTVDGAAASATVTDTEAGCEFGAALSSAGDADGDGLTDLLVGAPGHDATGDNDGAVYVFTRPLAATSAGAARGRVEGRGALSRAGGAVALAADPGGTGRPGAWLGMPGTEGSPGRVALFAEPILGVTDYSSRAADYVGEDDDGAGSSLSWADTDGDGAADLVIGSPGLGRVSLFPARFGP